MADPTIPKSRLDRVARDLSRTLWHGARPSDTAAPPLAFTLATGQQVPVTVPTNGDSLKFKFAVGVASTLVATPNADAAAAATCMQNVLADSKYFTLAPDRELPTWIFHPRQYSWAQPSAQDQLSITLPGSVSPLTIVTLPAAAIEEVEETSGSFVTLRTAAGASALDRAGWQPAILVRFPLKLSTPLSDFPSTMQVFELSGTPQGDRYFLDQLGLLPPGTGDPAVIAGIALTLETIDAASGLPTRSPITEWTIARTNLTEQARANAAESVAPQPTFPYIAGPDEAIDAVRLLEMASITNSGGYFLRATTGQASATALVLTVVLNPVLAPASPSTAVDTHGSARISTAANAIAFKKPNSQGSIVFPDFIRFEGLQHAQVVPAAPPGSVLFGWTRTQPATLDNALDDFGFGTISMVAYSAQDGSGASLVTLDSSDALSPADPLIGDQIGSGGAGLVPEDESTHTGNSAAMRLRAPQAGTPQPAAALAATTEVRYFRTTLDCSKPAGSPWGRLPDTRLRQITLNAGMRDIFGNAFPLASAAPIARTLFYTDALINPSEWPGVSFALYPGTQAGQPVLWLEMSYHFLAPSIAAPGDTAPQLMRDKRSRLTQLQAIITQLKGADGDVKIRLSAEPLVNSPIELDVASIIGSLQLWHDLEEKNENPLAAPLFYTPPFILCASSISVCKRFDPKLLITRSTSLYGPQDLDLPTDPGLRTLISGQVMKAEARVTLQQSATLLPAGGAVPPAADPNRKDTFLNVAKAFSDAISGHLGVQVGFLRDQTNLHELWIVPNSFFPVPDQTGPWTFATPRPLENTLGNEDFMAPDFTRPPASSPNTTIADFPLSRQSVTDQDYDVLGRSAMRFLEEQTADLKSLLLAGNAEVMRSLLQTREAIADSLATMGSGAAVSSRWLLPVLANPGALDIQAIARTAKDAFRQDLSAFYSVSTIVQLPLTTPGNAGIQIFEGEVAATFPDDAPKSTLPTFSDVILSQSDDPSGPGRPRIPDSRLTILYDLPADLKADQTASVKSLAVSFSHLQLPLDSGEQMPLGFNQGRWLRLVNPYVITWNAPGTGIPVADRVFPAKPVLKTTTPAPAWANWPDSDGHISVQPPQTLKKADIKALTAWGWQFSFSLLRPESTDRVYMDVLYNTSSPTAQPVDAALVPAAWTPSSLLANLAVLQKLQAVWPALDSALRLKALDSLTSSLADFLQRGPQPIAETGDPRLGLKQQTDSYTLTVSDTVVKPVQVSVMKDTPRLLSPLVSDAVETTATLWAPADSSGNTALLTGLQPIRSFKVSLTLTRNENLANQDANPALIYRCAKVQSPVDYFPLNNWGPPLPTFAYDAQGASLQAALNDFFVELFNSAALETMNLEISIALVWKKGTFQCVTPFSILPADSTPADTTAAGAANFVINQCTTLLGEPKPGAPILGPAGVDSAAIRLHVKVTEARLPAPPPPAPQPLPPRTLLEISAIDFALVLP